jgi:hypothetical protein
MLCLAEDNAMCSGDASDDEDGKAKTTAEEKDDKKIRAKGDKKKVPCFYLD